MFIFEGWAEPYESDRKGSRSSTDKSEEEEELRMMELEVEKLGVKGKQRRNWGNQQ